MITAISSVNQSGSKINSAKQATQVAFTGSPISLLKNEVKIPKFTDETTSSIGKVFKKLLGKAELPFSKKPLTANATIVHVLEGGGIVDIPVPELHVAVTKLLDGSNLLVPDAADLATNAMDALSTKAALMDTLAGTSHAFDAVTTGVDALAAKSATIDAIVTTIEHKSAIVDVIEGISHIIDKLPL